MAVVPPELNDHILDFLHADARALRACALVCRAWLPTARLHLFGAVVLPDTRVCAALGRLLLAAPHLRAYVRRVDIAAPDEKEHALLDAALASVFASLDHVQAVSLALLSFDARALASFAPRAAVTELGVQYCAFPSFGAFVALLDACPQLESLAVHGPSWATRSFDLPASPRRSKLRKLTVGRDVDGMTLVDWMLATGAHAGIEDLTLDCTSQDDATAVAPLLEACAPRLKRLDLSFDMPGAKRISLPPSLLLPPCPALEHLTLRCAIPRAAAVPWPSDLLAALEAPALASVSLDVRVCGPAGALDWPALDAAAPRFPELRALRLALQLWTGVRASQEEVRALVRAGLPLLDARGLVQFA